MARSERKRQQAIQRQTTKRKHKQQVVRQQSAPRTRRGILRTAAKWPIYECLMTKNWTNTQNLVQILVARRSRDGEIVTATFLVDLGCLGVKNAATASFATTSEYRDEYRAMIMQTQPLAPTDPNLAAKVIREAIEYARGLGFAPHRDYREAAILLADADPDAAHTIVPHGLDGKPFFAAGPYDDSAAIMRKLDKAVGPGNYHFLVAIPASDLIAVDDDPVLDDVEDLEILEEDEEWDEDEDEDEDGDDPRMGRGTLLNPAPGGSILARLADRLRRPPL